VCVCVCVCVYVCVCVPKMPGARSFSCLSTYGVFKCICFLFSKIIFNTICIIFVHLAGRREGGDDGNDDGGPHNTSNTFLSALLTGEKRQECSVYVSVRELFVPQMRSSVHC
jgi:hypothetical protein